MAITIQNLAEFLKAGLHCGEGWVGATEETRTPLVYLKLVFTAQFPLDLTIWPLPLILSIGASFIFTMAIDITWGFIKELRWVVKVHSQIQILFVPDSDFRCFSCQRVIFKDNICFLLSCFIRTETMRNSVKSSFHDPRLKAKPSREHYVTQNRAHWWQTFGACLKP